MVCGRKPLTEAEHRAKGTYRADRHSGTLVVPDADSDLPDCPGWLDDVAKERWAALAPKLAKMGLLAAIDREGLASLCQAAAEHQLATEVLRKEGRFQTSEVTGTSRAHPAVAMQRSAWQAIRQFSSMLGLDASSRSRLKMPHGGGVENADDPIAELIGRSETCHRG